MASQAQPSEIIKIDIFCRVIDNFGDAGVMWRLARSLTAEGFAVRLIIDDTDTLCALAGCPAKTPADLIGKEEGINVMLWEKAWDSGECPLQPPEVVIEGFACRLPQDYERKMAATRPLWFNIDYFSAEDSSLKRIMRRRSLSIKRVFLQKTRPIPFAYSFSPILMGRLNQLLKP